MSKKSETESDLSSYYYRTQELCYAQCVPTHSLHLAFEKNPEWLDMDYVFNFEARLIDEPEKHPDTQWEIAANISLFEGSESTDHKITLYQNLTEIQALYHLCSFQEDAGRIAQYTATFYCMEDVPGNESYDIIKIIEMPDEGFEEIYLTRNDIGQTVPRKLVTRQIMTVYDEVDDEDDDYDEEDDDYDPLLHPEDQGMACSFNLDLLLHNLGAHIDAQKLKQVEKNIEHVYSPTQFIAVYSSKDNKSWHYVSDINDESSGQNYNCFDAQPCWKIFAQEKLILTEIMESQSIAETINVLSVLEKGAILPDVLIDNGHQIVHNRYHDHYSRYKNKASVIDTRAKQLGLN